LQGDDTYRYSDDEELESLDWCSSTASSDSVLAAMKAGEHGPLPCPNTGCSVVGRRIQLHRLWCKFQPIRLHGGRPTATGRLARMCAEESDFKTFNQSFWDHLGLSFQFQEKYSKIKIRCRNTDKNLNVPYTIVFSLKNFDYKIFGCTNELKVHRLALPVRLSKRKLLKYRITICT
jgi:hypothetical protein